MLLFVSARFVQVMAVEKTLLALFGVVLVCLCYYNLLRAIPDQHALVMKENFELQQKLQQRIHPIASDPLPLPVEANNRGELDQCQDKLQEQLQISESLRNTLTENQANPLTPATTPQCNMGEKNRPLPLLILCHNRPDYLQRTLDNIIANRPSSQQFPIIVSQDGTHDGVWKLLNGPKYYQEVTAIQLQERGKASTSYHYIAQHFKFGISSVLEKLGFEDVIILEDDMEIAPDFFQYFLRMREELYKDESLYTASAWNDNGQNDHGRDPQNLKRSDFFPGLGWIMTGKLWKELGPKWPEGYWDDWMREPAQRKGRHCIFPEISRSWTFGEQGSSQGQFWKQYLKPVTLYSGPPVAFNSLDLSYLNDVSY